MIAVTTMMLVAEAYGFDAAPMEGFDPAKVKTEFGIPNEAEVVALLAIGHAEGPDKVYPGRFPCVPREVRRAVDSQQGMKIEQVHHRPFPCPEESTSPCFDSKNVSIVGSF
jgi:Nitroreductase family